MSSTRLGSARDGWRAFAASVGLWPSKPLVCAHVFQERGHFGGRRDILWARSVVRDRVAGCRGLYGERSPLPRVQSTRDLTLDDFLAGACDASMLRLGSRGGGRRVVH